MTSTVLIVSQTFRFKTSNNYVDCYVRSLRLDHYLVTLSGVIRSNQGPKGADGWFDNLFVSNNLFTIT